MWVFVQGTQNLIKTGIELIGKMHRRIWYEKMTGIIQGIKKMLGLVKQRGEITARKKRRLDNFKKETQQLVVSRHDNICVTNLCLAVKKVRVY